MYTIFKTVYQVSLNKVNSYLLAYVCLIRKQ